MSRAKVASKSTKCSGEERCALMVAQQAAGNQPPEIEDAGASAKTLNRDGLQDALGRLERGEAGALIVTNLDRLTRSVSDLATLIENHFTRFSLVSVGEQIDTSTAVGRLVLNVLMSVAQWEREAISERTKTALQHKKRNGERVGSIPYGYHLGADGVMLEVDAEEQEITQAVRELHSAGLSLCKIAAQLTAIGYKSRSGGTFHHQTVRNIITAQKAA